MPALFIGDNPALEAVYEDRGSDRCVVVTHPHSLMGGNMHNNVVMAAWRACLDRGLSALRFNFRGVGRSGGSFDEGEGEMADLSSVIMHVKSPVIIVGYSFGAWVAARYLKRLDDPVPCIFISPPTAMFSFPSMKGDPVWAVTGGSDQFCSIPVLEGLIDGERILTVRQADHFWFGEEDLFVPFVMEKIDLILGSGPQ
jgi:alpha/beta superfamily hydrolase